MQKYSDDTASVAFIKEGEEGEYSSPPRRLFLHSNRHGSLIWALFPHSHDFFFIWCSLLACLNITTDNFFLTSVLLLEHFLEKWMKRYGATKAAMQPQDSGRQSQQKREDIHKPKKQKTQIAAGNAVALCAMIPGGTTQFDGDRRLCVWTMFMSLVCSFSVRAAQSKSSNRFSHCSHLFDCCATYWEEKVVKSLFCLLKYKKSLYF